jgi:hypothetical protein
MSQRSSEPLILSLLRHDVRSAFVPEDLGAGGSYLSAGTRDWQKAVPHFNDPVTISIRTVVSAGTSTGALLTTVRQKQSGNRMEPRHVSWILSLTHNDDATEGVRAGSRCA